MITDILGALFGLALVGGFLTAVGMLFGVWGLVLVITGWIIYNSKY